MTFLEYVAVAMPTLVVLYAIWVGVLALRSRRARTIDETRIHSVRPLAHSGSRTAHEL